MRSIEDIIAIITESNYFEPWANVLLGDYAVDAWHKLLQNTSSDNLYKSLGENLHLYQVPFVIVTEYIDEFFRYMQGNKHDCHNIKNKIAQAYLIQKLSADSDIIHIELEKKLYATLETKRDLINAHLRWMQAFITNIIDEPVPLELDSSKCHVGLWLLEDTTVETHAKIDKLHQNLHAMAMSATRMYKREDYAYFLLLYLDILMSSYQIRDLIMNVYFAKQLTSIYRDPLSHQPNYFQLKDDISNNTEDNSLFVFNIKEFSKINLLFGHEIGDNLLQEIIDNVLHIEGVSQVYRIYGDEFAILFPSSKQNSILKSFKYHLEEHEFQAKNSSIALSFYGSTAVITPHVLERCEYGLMISKSQHGKYIDVDAIDSKLLENYANNITLAEQLRLAFMDNRVIPYYQPIYNFKTQSITKYEVLMRIEDISNNILQPREFLDVMQNMYIYPEVTKLIIQKTFDTFKDNKFEFSLNLSFADIIDLDTESFIIAILKRYPEAASRCTFELLENEAIRNHKEVRDFFDLLHSYGVKIAIDDFGVGFSNYDTIFQFDIDYIKIDGSLTESILTNHKSLVLMESIITVAKELDAKIIAEFVSSKEIFDKIKTMNVDFAQGYFIAEPSPKL
jgi:EAL domain-containing protein (putative c-di-GMP-specific phosphodiesterase class I)